MRKTALRLVAIVPAAATALSTTAAYAQSTNPVDTELAGADLTTRISTGQGLILAAIIVLVGFTMLRKVFSK